MILLDVRKEEEFAVSHLPGARCVDPSLDSVKVLSGVDKGALVVAYCSVGYRSSEMVRMLQALGYEQVYNLRGSIFAWGIAGYLLEDALGKTQKIHPYNSVWGRLLPEALRE